VSNSKTYHGSDTMVVIRAPRTTERSALDDIPQNIVDTYHGLMKVLGHAGFTIQRDPAVTSRWKSLGKTHHHAQRGDLQCTMEVYPAGCKLEFYQEVNVTNPNGGRYDFNKLEKMPYLVKVAFRYAFQQVTAYLKSQGYITTDDDPARDAWERVAYLRREMVSRRYYKGTVESYNAKDRDGVMLRDGDIRYYRDHQGVLWRGIVMHNINNMWWVVSNDHIYHNIASFYLFSLPPGCPLVRKLRPKTVCIQRLQQEKAKAVQREDFEKAAILRDILRVKHGVGLVSGEGEADVHR